MNTGRLGPAGADLLYKTVYSVAIARRFPPPEGHRSWDQAAAQECAHDFLTEERGEKRLADLVVRALDEESFEKLLHKAVLNFHRDRARRSDFGALVRRLGDVLERSDGVEQVPSSPSRWKVAGGASDPSPVPFRDLAAAASRETDVVVPQWSGRRRAPLADYPSLERLCIAILRAADGSLTTVDLTHAIAARLDVRRIPLTLELDVFEQVPDAGQHGQTERRALLSIRSQELFDALSDRERTLLATREQSLRNLEQTVGVRKSQANALRQMLYMRLAQDLGDDPERDEVIIELCDLADDWMRQRTSENDSTY